MGTATAVVSEKNVKLRGALEACAGLRGLNAFLDHALDAGRIHLPEETKLVGYAAQERAFLVFLKTLEPHLPKSPERGPRSRGELLLRSETNETWLIIFRYGARPQIAVRRLAWLGVPLGKVRPLRAGKGAREVKGTRLVDPSGDFVVARVEGNRLIVVRGAAGSRGKEVTQTFAHPKQATAALDRLLSALRRKHFRLLS